MKSEGEQFEAGFSLGARRYIASHWKEARASGLFCPAPKASKDQFTHALKELSAEDEETPLPDGQGPIIYKDGIFQIDLANAGKPSAIDPALKGLIDSILGT